MGIFNKTKDKKSVSDVQETKVDAEKKVSMKSLYKDEAGKSEPKKVVSDTGEQKKQSVSNGMAYRVLVKPLITEKASFLAAENKYVFAVAVDANKIEISKAIQEVYGIKPSDVNIVNMKGKKTRYGRSEGKKKDWKKAIITLPAGQTIKVYEGV